METPFMRPFPRVFLAVLIALSLSILAACDVAIDDVIGPESADDSAASSESESETPETEEDSAEAEFTYSLLASDKRIPPMMIGDIIIELAEDEESLSELWEWFEFDTPAPVVDWDQEIVIFFGTGESGTCPLDLEEVRFHPDERLVVAVVDPNLPRDAICTMDWTPRTFVVALSGDALGSGELRAGIEHGPQARGIDPPGGLLLRESENSDG
jgi:hypothetical protein